MTLQSSGSMTSSDIKLELRQESGSLVFPDATTRWLADKPSGSLILPTDYYSKRGLKYTGAMSVSTGGTNPHSQSVPLGEAYPSRTIVGCICSIASGGSALNITSMSIGGVPMTLGPAWGHNDAGTAIRQGIAYLEVPSGTSATMAVSFNRPATNTLVRIFSFPSLGPIVHQNEFGNTGAGVSANIDIGKNAVAFINCVKLNAFGSNFTFTGADEEFDSDIGGNVHHGVAVINRLSPQTNRPMSCTSTGGAQLMSIASISIGDTPPIP